MKGLGTDDFHALIRELGVVPQHMAAATQIYEAIAAATIVSDAKSRGAGGTKMQRSAAEGVLRTGPGIIKYGGRPYSIGAEYGAYQYKQFEAWRGNAENAGYFLWPAVRAFVEDDMNTLWFREVYDRVIKPIFPGWS